MADHEALTLTLEKHERDTIYLACRLLLAAKGIKQDAKGDALRLMHRLQYEEDKHL